jgi:hypothetical protein
MISFLGRKRSSAFTIGFSNDIRAAQGGSAAPNPGSAAILPGPAAPAA